MITPQPPDGYRLMTDEEKRLSLKSKPMWALSKEWIPSKYDIGDTIGIEDQTVIYATRDPLPETLKGGDEPCAPKMDPSTEQTASAQRIPEAGSLKSRSQDVPSTGASNAPSEVQSLATGAEPAKDATGDTPVQSACCA